jgi:hypothetical protein
MALSVSSPALWLGELGANLTDAGAGDDSDEEEPFEVGGGRRTKH